MKKPAGNSRWIFRFHCCTYPSLGLKYGARVGDPVAATNDDVLGCAFLPGGKLIPTAPKGPWFAVQVKDANVFAALTGSEQPVEFNVADGVSPALVVAVNGVVARETTSKSGFTPNET